MASLQVADWGGTWEPFGAPWAGMKRSVAFAAATV